MKNIQVLSPLFFALFLFGSLSSQSFEEVSISGLTTIPTGSRSANFVDVNGDFWDDIFISNGPSSGEDNMLYINNQDGTFTFASGDDIVNDSDRSDGASFADADNDGDMDAVVVTFGANGQGRRNYFYRNNGDGTFNSEGGGNAISTPMTYSEMVSWVDINNDQNLDVYITNSVGNRRNMYFENQGNNSFVPKNDLEITNEVSPSRGIDWIDYDGDGDSDLFVTNESNLRNTLYRNDGANTFVQVTNLALVQSARSSAGNSWGDIDNDGDFDLFVANYNSNGQANQLFRNDGGDFTELVNSAIAADITNSFGSTFGDLDNDGDLDLLVCNAYLDSQNTNFIYMNDGSGNFILDTTSSLALHEGWTFGAAMGDYNNDGWLDVILANNFQDDERNSLFKNTGSGNNWLKLNLIGTDSNRSAIGAKITLTSSINGVEVEQMRSVRSNSGYCSQNSYSVHFGLNTGTEADQIEIQWPSGLTETFENIASNDIYTVVEGENSLGIEDIAGSLFSVFPNPTADLLFFNIPEFFDTQNCLIHIYALNGKFVKTVQLLEIGTGIDVSQLQDGMYVYQIVRDQGKMSAGTFVKN